MSHRVEVTLTIDLEYPIRCIGKRELKSHIVDAVERWGGQYHPEDYLFDGVKKVTPGAVKVLT